jgi:hypothetical protein
VVLEPHAPQKVGYERDREQLGACVLPETRAKRRCTRSGELDRRVVLGWPPVAPDDLLERGEPIDRGIEERLLGLRFFYRQDAPSSLVGGPWAREPP